MSCETGKVGDSNLKMRVLGTYGYVIVGSSTYLAQRGVPREPEDLAGHDCLFHRWTASGKLERWVLSRNGTELDFQPPPSSVANTMEPLIGLAERGLGLFYTPTFTVRRQLADGTLLSVLDGFLRNSGTLQILWPPSRHGSPKIKAFVEVMARMMLADGA